MLQFFSGINSIEKFLNLSLPIAKYSTENGSGRGDGLEKLDVKMKESILFEIDLMQIKKYVNKESGI